MEIEFRKLSFLSLALVLSALLAAGCGQKENHAAGSAKPAGVTEKGHGGEEKGHGGNGYAEHDENEDHDEHEEHEEEGHDEHGHDEHGDEQVVHLDAEAMKEFGIETAQAGPGALEVALDLPGEIVVNADRLAHIVPRVGGVVRKVNKSLGDTVRRGEVMAVLESRELADAKASFLAAEKRVELAQANFRREEDLWRKKVSAEQEYLDARQALAEAQIERRSAEQKLHALGLSDQYLKELPTHQDITYTRYEITAPFAGTVIEKHITLGESLEGNADAFTIADLSSVWVNVSVYQKDLAAVRKGQKARIITGHGVPDAEGEISFVGPLVGEATRTATARIILPNPDGSFRPGMFITAQVAVDRQQVPLVIPKTALQTVEEKTVVFVLTDEGFEPVPVEVGRQNGSNVEIVSGLHSGDTYAAKGAFTLKAQLSKGAFGDGHNH